jgi:hypothetical protein
VSPDRVGGLRRALDQAPENHALRLLLAETLEQQGDAAQAAEQYAVLLELGQLPPESLVAAGWTALEAERLDLADRLAAAAESAGLDEAGPLRAELESRRESEEPVLERTFAFHHFKRLLVRYGRRHEIHEAFLALGCCLVCFRRLRTWF